MSEAVTLQTQTTKATQSNSSSLLLQRKCACGGSSGLTGTCSDCEKKKFLGIRLQTKLRVNEPGDEYEQEADRVAEQVMWMANATVNSKTSLFRETPLVQRRVSGNSAAGIGSAPPIVHDVLSSPGQPLDAATRAFFEPRFGHDFAHVRVHADAKAAESAQAVSALAYTVGSDIVLGANTQSPTAKELFAHELAHVLQAGGEDGRTLHRRPRPVEIDGSSILLHSNSLAQILPERRPAKIASLISKFGGLPSDSMLKAIEELSPDAQYWFLQAIYLLLDNRTIRKKILYKEAIDRLLIYAPSAEYQPLPAPDERFAREVLGVSGWSAHVALKGLLAPEEATKAEIAEITNPPVEVAGPGALDIDELRRRLYPALEHYLSSSKAESGKWGPPQTRSLTHFQEIANTMFRQAREYFSPFADTAAVDLARMEGWRSSESIYSVTDQPPSKLARYELLSNRAEVVGRNADSADPRFSDTNIFQDVHFDAANEEHKTALNSILWGWADESSDLKELLDRLVRHTAETRGIAVGTEGPTRIGLSTEYDPLKETACDGNWNGIYSLSHEMIHALGNPDFWEKKMEIGHGQIVSEGFTEVLGVQFFNDHVVKKAAVDPEFKAKLEAGVSGAPCPSPTAASIGYGEAGRAAEQIRQKVGDDRFRAAYFLGRPDLAGLPE